MYTTHSRPIQEPIVAGCPQSGQSVVCLVTLAPVLLFVVVVVRVPHGPPGAGATTTGTGPEAAPPIIPPAAPPTAAPTGPPTTAPATAPPAAPVRAPSPSARARVGRVAIANAESPMIMWRMISSSIQFRDEKKHAVERMVPAARRCLVVRRAERPLCQNMNARRDERNKRGRAVIMLRGSRPNDPKEYEDAPLARPDRYHLSGWRRRCPFADHSIHMEYRAGIGVSGPCHPGPPRRPHSAHESRSRIRRLLNAQADRLRLDNRHRPLPASGSPLIFGVESK